MNKKYFLSLALLVTNLFYAQNIEFEDDSLKNYLINQDCAKIGDENANFTPVDSDGDGEISFDEANAVHSLYFDYFPSENFSEISYFENLKKIDISSVNSLNSIDLSSNTLLEEIIFFNIDNIIFENNLNLKQIILSGNDYSENGLDFSNLTQLETLSVSDLGLNTIDLSNNINLKNLYIENNNLENLDLSNNINLQILYAGNNDLNSLLIDNATSLKLLKANNCNLNSLDLSNLPNLENLNVQENNLNSLDFSNNLELKIIDLNENNLTSLDLSNNLKLNEANVNDNSLSTITLANPELKYLFLDRNNLTSLDISNCNILRTLSFKLNNITDISSSFNAFLLRLDAAQNQLTNLEVSNFPNLENLLVNQNNLNSINLDTSNKIEQLNLAQNPIEEVNIEYLTSIYYLNISNTNISEIDLLNNLDLKVFNCSNTNINSLDLSTNSELENLIADDNNFEELDLTNNHLIINLSIKNNESTINKLLLNEVYYGFLFTYQNTLFNYICISNEYVFYYKNLIHETQPDCLINDFCKEDPLNSTTVVFGDVKYNDNNDICDENDNSLQNLKFDIESADFNGNLLVPNKNGYELPLEYGDYTIQPIIENAHLFSVSPESVDVTFNYSNPLEIKQDFCITTIEEDAAFDLTIIPLTDAIPGKSTAYKLIYQNIGSKTTSGELTFNYNTSLLEFTDAIPLENTHENGIISWNYEDLKPFDSRSIVLNFNTKYEAPTDITNEITTSISFSDETENETENFKLKQPISTLPSDGNNMICLDGSEISNHLIGDYLTYKINFKNTTSTPVVNLIIENVLLDSSHLIGSSLKVIESTHDYLIKREYDSFQFIFEDIILSNEEGFNEGYIIFKIKIAPGTELDDVINNSVSIKFDYEEEIITNIAKSEFLSTEDFENTDLSITIFPNPVSDVLKIEGKYGLNNLKIFNILGENIKNISFENNLSQAEVNVSNIPSGIYFIKIDSKKGSLSKKIIIK
ncbi:T9SS type A sorting domain-containing protein [Aureivirga sp. CE67]|uniref:T9SS type A sorting domain-containing protein n=1 Tax=Aureivirga sp. CE67 TaxID=1788983 RepID=UPI0018CBB553|nr:T9SS type A sorting domain-containing protein [Aureivirga sp. CE67]